VAVRTRQPAWAACTKTQFIKLQTTGEPKGSPVFSCSHHTSRRGSQATGRSARLILPLCGALCDTSHMATNLAIDPDLLERAVEVSGERTKTAAVTRALEEFIARRQQAKIADLFGTLEWDHDYEYKVSRSRK
jgi:hypothetical protein